jgi:hypothetical protein
MFRCSEKAKNLPSPSQSKSGVAFLRAGSRFGISKWKRDANTKPTSLSNPKKFLERLIARHAREMARYVTEHSGQRCAHRSNGTDNDNGNQSRDQTVFDRRGSFFFLQQTSY